MRQTRRDDGSHLAFAAALVVAALASTFVMMRMAGPQGFLPALVAFLAIIGTQLVFWSFTFPVNKATKTGRTWQTIGLPFAADGSFPRSIGDPHLLAVVSTTIAALAQRA